MKILMTGAGAPGGPGIMRLLSADPAFDLHVCDANIEATGRFLATKRFHLIPKATDDTFIDYLLDLCRSNGIEVIFPLVTLELFKLAKFKKIFLSNGIDVIVSDENALNVSNNKGLLYKHLAENKIRVPKFVLVKSKNKLLNAAAELGYPNNAVVMKPCVGNGSRGVRVLDENADRFDLLFNQKPSSLVSTLSQVIKDISGNQIPEIVLSEYLPGEELTIDTIVENGVVEDCLIRTRKTINSGISVSGTFVESEEVSDYIRSIVATLKGLKGPVGFQVKRSDAGDYLLLECNPRIQGTSVAAIGLGVNLPLRAVYQTLGMPREPLLKKSGMSFNRYYQEVFYEN